MWTAFATAAGGAFIASRLSPDRADPKMYLDYVYTGFKLVELNFVPKGTLLHFYDHRIGFDYPSTAAVTRTGTELLYGGTTEDFLHALTPAIYSLAMELRPTHEFPCTRLFFLLIWKGCYRLKNSYLAAREVLSAAHIQRGPIRMIERILRGKELKPQKYGIGDASNSISLHLSHRVWRTGEREFPKIHLALLAALHHEICNRSEEATGALIPAKHYLKDFVTTLPSSEQTQWTLSATQYNPVFTATDFSSQMTPELQKTIEESFWNWFEQEYADDSTLNRGQWLTRMGIPRSPEWLGIPSAVTQEPASSSESC